MATKRSPSVCKQQQLTVAVRIRPIFSDEISNGAGHIAHKVDGKMVILMDPHAADSNDILRAKRSQDKQHLFDWVFDDKSSQEEVYQKTTRKLVENVLEGYNGTVFAYGATGSGKTYTMVGTDEDPGMMVTALQDLFYYLDEKEDRNNYEVHMSYLEIYNENIRDLLLPASNHLDLREDARGNHQVVGLSEISIGNSIEVMKLLTRGNRQRTQEPTGANKTSSRSHALLLVQVVKKSPMHDMVQEVKTGKLYMVDLAGSERASQTQVCLTHAPQISYNTGKRLVEGAHINKSLLALGNCINALADRSGPRYVNFRDSKLTRLLKEPLSGNCKTVMIAHISPASIHYEESRNTLSYADRAKNITNKVRSNVDDLSYHVAQYQTIINELRQEIQMLRSKVVKQQTSRGSHSPSRGEVKKLSDDEMKKLKEELISTFNRQMEVRKRIMDIDNSLLFFGTEIDKLGMILNEWEAEKVKREPIDNELYERDEEKRQSADEQQPVHVEHAWEDMQFVQQEQQRHLEYREKAEKEFLECKEKTYRLTEALPEKASCEEQRELLNLLTRVHELEVEKMEMQAEQLVREHELRQKDLMILRYDRQRQLCEEIITKQRALIDAMTEGKEEDAQTNHELKELYRIYQQDIQELNGGRDSIVRQQESNTYRGFRPLGSSESMTELTNLNKRSSNYPSALRYSPNDNRLFSYRSRPLSDGEQRSESHLSLHSHYSSVPTSPISKLPPIRQKETFNIAAIAAKKRSQQTEKNKHDIAEMDKYFTTRKSVKETTPGRMSRNSVYIKRAANAGSKNRPLNETFQRNGMLPSLRRESYSSSPKEQNYGDGAEGNLHPNRRLSIGEIEKLAARSPSKPRPRTVDETVGFSLNH